MSSSTRRGVAKWLFAACGVWLVGLGLYFILLRPPLLPEDLRYMNVDASAVQAAVPGLAGWLDKVFTVMGGFIIGTGILTLGLARILLTPGSQALRLTLALAGVSTVGLMSAVNFALHSDYRWLLLAPAMLWAVGWALWASGRTDLER